MEVTKIKEVLPPEVVNICERLAAKKERGYVVGGSIRDVLMGRIAHDWDIATTATPAEVMRLFPRTVPTGVAHGTVTVLFGKKGFEITTLRGEGTYSDGRRPDSVEFIDDVAEDLSRRDFTINAIAFDPVSNELFDPFDGRRDIQGEVLRAVGDPAVRFKEDGLRVMRAARFASTLEFVIEPKTLSAMGQCAYMLQKVSVERKRDELFKLLFSRKPSIGMSIIEQSGLSEYVWPRFDRELRPDDRIKARLDQLPMDLPLRLACLVLPLDLRTASSDKLGQWVRNTLRELKSDNNTINRVYELVSWAEFSYETGWTDTQLRQLLKAAGGHGALDLVELWEADASAVSDGGYGQSVAELKQRLTNELSKNPPLQIKDLVIGGRDLMVEMQIPPGPQVGIVLEALLDRVLKDPTQNQRDALLAEAKTIVSDLAKNTCEEQ